MLNFNPALSDPAAILRNQRAIERHVDYDHYALELPPGSWEPFPGEAAAFDTNPRFGGWSFPNNGVDSRVITSEIPRSQWRTGRFRITVLYTSDVGSTNNFQFLFNFFAEPLGGVMDATASIVFASGITIPGPAVAYTLLERVFYTTAAMPAGTRILGLSHGRSSGNAADVNVNDLVVNHVLIEHIPAVRESQ